MKNFSLNRQQLTLLWVTLSAITLIGYGWFYYFQPFSEFVTQLALNVITVFSALLCAMMLTLISTFYEPGEPSRKIWVNFALALWMWTVGEIIWAIYNTVVGEPPIVTSADAVWMLGYVFMTVAITAQFRLITFAKSSKPVWVAIGVWILAILSTLAILILTGTQAIGEEFFTYFYPIGDFVIGLSSVILVIVFHRGFLSRVWLGLFVFAISDGLYAWATTSGLYIYESPNGNLVTLITDLTYILAYLAVAGGAFQQYLALRFGLPISERDTKPTQSLTR